MSAKVLFVSAEALPLAKTGGLGDVVSALAAALHRRGTEVSILLPAYPQAKQRAQSLRRIESFTGLGNRPSHLALGYMPETGVPVILLECDELFDRTGTPYATPAGDEFGDNGQRFAALAHAAAYIASGASLISPPDVVHAHDWHAGLTALYMKEHGVKIPSALTIHNLAFQGNFPISLAASIDVDATYLGSDGIEFWDQLSFLKAGIRYAERITTVSRSYREEILTPRFGCGLEGLLNERRDDLVAIPNGVDTKSWDPLTDPAIAMNYSAANLKGKIACKMALQQRLNLNAEPFAPIIALGSRLTTQKMADVALHSLGSLLDRHSRLQCAVLGAGEIRLEQGFRELALRYPGRVGVFIGYDEDIAHSLHAGADILLHGSRFEPFGLTPVYSMLYGTIPVASRVGGLIDTITDAGFADEPADGATGFLFDGDSVEEMSEAIERALRAFGEPALWRALQRNGMSIDFNWDISAEQYLDLYASLTIGATSESFSMLKGGRDPVTEEEPISHMMRA